MEAESLKDIKDIPFFAFEPGLYHWIAFVVVVALAYLTLKALQRSLTKNKPLGIIQQSLKTILDVKNKLAPDADLKSSLYLCSSQARRLISYTENDDFSSLSKHEIQEKLSSSQNPTFKELLNSLLELEQYKYQPKYEFDNSRSLIAELANKLQTYTEELATK